MRAENRKFQGQNVQIVWGDAGTADVHTLDDKGASLEKRRYATAELEKLLAEEDRPTGRPEGATVHFDDRAPGATSKPAPALVVGPDQQMPAVGSRPMTGAADWPDPNLSDKDDANDAKLPSLVKGESAKQYRDRVKGSSGDD